jgi:hypothetical protein
MGGASSRRTIGEGEVSLDRVTVLTTGAIPSGPGTGTSGSWTLTRGGVIFSSTVTTGFGSGGSSGVLFGGRKKGFEFGIAGAEVGSTCAEARGEVGLRAVTGVKTGVTAGVEIGVNSGVDAGDKDEGDSGEDGLRREEGVGLRDGGGVAVTATGRKDGSGTG